MKISVIGSGHVGLVTGACLADLGNKVICVDSDKHKIGLLKKGILSIYEPGLEDLVHNNIKEGRLLFSTSIKEAVNKSSVIFIAVSTPQKENGEADLSFVEDVSRQIALSMQEYKLIVEKSTTPVNTGEWIKHTVNIYLSSRYKNRKNKVKFDIASNPEFLREGSAVWDFMNPERIVIGVETKKAKEILLELYRPLNAPVVATDIKSAELIKHCSNSFLSMKISFINAVSNICEKTGADVFEIAKGIGLDKRIGKDFLDAGIGFGGSCFPKDLNAFIHICEKLGYDFKLLKSVREINETQRSLFVKKVENQVWILRGKTVGALGLSYKPNTDDIRYSPAIQVIRLLQSEGVNVKVYDPKAMENSKKILNDVIFCKNPYEVAKDSSCLLILTEWNEFKEIDLLRIKKLLKQPLIIDGRNIYDPSKMKKLGFKYISIGRPLYD